MNITLKQGDIEQAVKMFVERQGINLYNKVLEIDFAMGRGKNGLSASLLISDIAVPGFTHEDDRLTAKASNVTGLVGGTVTKDTDTKKVEQTAAVAVATAEPVVTLVDNTPEIPVTAPATLAEVKEAGMAVAVEVATQETEAPLAAEVAPVPAAEAQIKPTTSLFG